MEGKLVLSDYKWWLNSKVVSSETLTPWNNYNNVLTKFAL